MYTMTSVPVLCVQDLDVDPIATPLHAQVLPHLRHHQRSVRKPTFSQRYTRLLNSRVRTFFCHLRLGSQVPPCNLIKVLTLELISEKLIDAQNFAQVFVIWDFDTTYSSYLCSSHSACASAQTTQVSLPVNLYLKRQQQEFLTLQSFNRRRRSPECFKVNFHGVIHL